MAEDDTDRKDEYEDQALGTQNTPRTETEDESAEDQEQTE
jgi:hypothetical protein